MSIKTTMWKTSTHFCILVNSFTGYFSLISFYVSFVAVFIVHATGMYDRIYSVRSASTGTSVAARKAG